MFRITAVGWFPGEHDHPALQRIGFDSARKSLWFDRLAVFDTAGRGVRLNWVAFKSGGVGHRQKKAIEINRTTKKG
jgi:hypothetical protein